MGNVKIYDNNGVLCDPCTQSIRLFKSDGTLSSALKNGDKIYKPDGSLVTIVCDSGYCVKVENTGSGSNPINCLGDQYTQSYSTITFTLTDGINTITYPTEISVTMNITLEQCYSSNPSTELILTIPIGQSSVSYTFYDSWNDCGQGECRQEYEFLNSVVNATTPFNICP